MTFRIGRSPLSLAELISQLPAGARVLDLGCGGGTFQYRNFPEIEIHAVDEAVQDKVKEFPPHVEFRQGVASAIPEENESVDLVVANFAFEHFPDPVAALGEIERVLRDNGRAWISMPNAGSFEDQLYRNLFAGGGHLQRPTLEWFLRHVYRHTALKLIAFIELPAGFTYLGETPELRFLTWALVDALRRTVAVDAVSRSGYIFVLEKFASAGPGFREHLRTCSACGGPDGERPEGAPAAAAGSWSCPACGAVNERPDAIPIERLDEVSRAVAVHWQRYPGLSPERLKELAEERTRWAQQLEEELAAERRRTAELAAEVGRLREHVRRLQGEKEAVEAKLTAEVGRLREHVRRLQGEKEAVEAELGRIPGWVKRRFRER